MPFSGMLRRVALVRAVVSEERSASIITVTRIGELGPMLAVSSNRCTLRRSFFLVFSTPILVTLMMEALRYSKASAVTRATRHNIPEDVILHSHLPENLKSYAV
jgi:hypothetical protein